MVIVVLVLVIFFDSVRKKGRAIRPIISNFLLSFIGINPFVIYFDKIYHFMKLLNIPELENFIFQFWYVLFLVLDYNRIGIKRNVWLDGCPHVVVKDRRGRLK